MKQLTVPLVRGVSYTLIYVTALSPLHPAFAAGIHPATSNTHVQHHHLPVVNIATPNGAGISHNTYRDFNVGTPGAVLNNATTAGRSVLAGNLQGNPNLKGKAAELIINEVTSGSRSELQGKLEVFGNQASVIVANPNGITCNDCGFINLPGIMLTTGKPQFDKQGALDALDIQKGAVNIGNNGLDAQGLDYVDILSRATALNGKIQAKNLALIQGANRINLTDGHVHPIAGEGVKPALAVDTHALGGMYANKIRLVATEAGVGVNLTDIHSQQRDIMLSVNGKIQLGNTQSKTDLTVSATAIHLTAGSEVSSQGDITLAANELENRSNVTAKQGMRIFADTVKNSGQHAVLHSDNGLWIQKDAQGTLSQQVENRSAQIKTSHGDMVIRTEQLNNVRDIPALEKRPLLPTSTDKNLEVLNEMEANGMYRVIITAKLSTPLPNRWFGKVDFSHPYQKVVNDEQTLYLIDNATAPAQLSSGKNLYIHGNTLYNHDSLIHANSDLFLTGQSFNNEQTATGTVFNFVRYLPEEKADKTFFNPAHDLHVTTHFMRGNPFQTWTETYLATAQASLSAGKNLVADFKKYINISTPFNHYAPALKEVTTSLRPDAVTGDNIVLHGESILLTDGINARRDLSIIADDWMKTHSGAQLTAGHAITATAINNITAVASQITGQDITLISKEGDIGVSPSRVPTYFQPDGSPLLTRLAASHDLTLSAGKGLLLRDVQFAPQSNHIHLSANDDLTIDKSDALLMEIGSRTPPTPHQEQTVFNPVRGVGNLTASGAISINSGGALALNGIHINAGKTLSLFSGNNTDLNLRTLDEHDSHLFPTSSTPTLRSQMHAGGDLLIHSARDIRLQGADIASSGSANLLAGRTILMNASEEKANENTTDSHPIVTQLRSDKGLTLAANQAILTEGAHLSSQGDMTLTAGENMHVAAVTNKKHTTHSGGYREQLTQQGTQLTAGGLMTLMANGSILFQASQLHSQEPTGAIDIAAKGGYLYAQALEEVNHFEYKKKTCHRWTLCMTKKEVKKVRHDVTHKVTEFTAAGDINLLSRDDSTYEASKLSAGKHARLTSTQGSVNFNAVNDTAFEQTLTHSKGFFIKHADKGYTEGKWVMPRIHTGGKLTVEAATGIRADIKAQNRQSLDSAITALGNTPGTEWLKGLNTRDDVQWSLVMDAYDSWDYESQHLNPAVAAVIAIAAAAVTAGSSLVAAAASSAAATVGGGAITSGAVSAGMQALASQVAVKLVENRGNLSKTLNALGNSDTVKATATAMAIGGALNGFDQTMGWSQNAKGHALNPQDVKLPQLSNGDWSNVAQRVAGQSVISASLNSAIHGGSMKENLTNSLLANVGGQINAEGAKLIGDNGDILGLPGKAVSHAVLAGISAEIGRGNSKGAAAGALAAELAGAVMQNTLFEPAFLNEKARQLYRLQDALNGNTAKEQTARVIGALTGAMVTHTPEGAYSAADSAQNVYRYNMTEHMLENYALQNSRDMLAAERGDKAAAQRVVDRREAAAVVLVVGMGGALLSAGGALLVGAAPEVLLAARLAMASCKTNPALCLNKAGIYAADILAPDAVIGTGALASGATLVIGKTQDSATKLAQQLSKTADELYSTKKLNTAPVAEFIQGETNAGAAFSPKTANYLRDIKDTHTAQLVKLFDRTQPNNKLVIFGQEFEQVLGEGGSNKRGTTKVFATEKLSEQAIFNYAQSLTGGKPFEEVKPGMIWTAVLDQNTGHKVTLRNISSSADETKARWTIDIIGNEQLNNLQGKKKNPTELKFR